MKTVIDYLKIALFLLIQLLKLGLNYIAGNIQYVDKVFLYDDVYRFWDMIW